MGKERLKVNRFSSGDKFQEITFSLHEGEVLGIAGLTGSGRSEVMQAIFGYLEKETGEVVMEGNLLSVSDPNTAIKNKIMYSPEDRKDQGLFLNHSVAMNVTSTCLKECSISIFISKKKENDITNKMVKDLSIKVSGIDQEVNSLSGGNQQKVLLAKCLVSQPKVLIVDEPTRGIDVGSKIEIYNLLRGFANSGGSVILISSELTEIIGLSDRVLVFKEGKIVDDLSENINEDSITRLMFKQLLN